MHGRWEEINSTEVVKDRLECFGRQKKMRKKQLGKAEDHGTWNRSIRKILITLPSAPRVQFVFSCPPVLQYIDPDTLLWLLLLPFANPRIASWENQDAQNNSTVQRPYLWPQIAILWERLACHPIILHSHSGHVHRSLDGTLLSKRQLCHTLCSMRTWHKNYGLKGIYKVMMSRLQSSSSTLREISDRSK